MSHSSRHCDLFRLPRIRKGRKKINRQEMRERETKRETERERERGQFHLQKLACCFNCESINSPLTEKKGYDADQKK